MNLFSIQLKTFELLSFYFIVHLSNLSFALVIVLEGQTDTIPDKTEGSTIRRDDLGRSFQHHTGSPSIIFVSCNQHVHVYGALSRVAYLSVNLVIHILYLLTQGSSL